MGLTPTERTKARNAPEYQRYAEGFCRQFNRRVSGEDGEQVSSADEVSRKRTSISEKRSAGFVVGGDGQCASMRLQAARSGGELEAGYVGEFL